jgi:CubicO group peptidase (beta-lactamase class C family)
MIQVTDSLIPFSKVNRKKAVLLLMFILSLNGCIPYQAYLYMLPDEKDIHRFKHAEVKHAKVCYDFNKQVTNKEIFVTNWSCHIPLSKEPLEQFLKEHEANHFLVIKNDSIVFEYTDEKITRYEPSPSFSISKSFVSATFGVALKEGYIGSPNDLVKDYIPELNYHKNFDYLTINHLLNQTSGIKMEVDNISECYYGKIEKGIKELHFIAKPGEHLEYINLNTILVGVVIERATKRNLYEYFSEKIWSKIGTCDSTVWGYDYKTNHTRSFSCFGGSPRDYAKFGRLYLHKGKWENEQIIDSNWVIASTSTINAMGENVGYNNYWFIGEKEIKDFMAIGMYRQQIYINPKENVIIVCLMKFHKKNLPLRWWELLRQISRQA